MLIQKDEGTGAGGGGRVLFLPVKVLYVSNAIIQQRLEGFTIDVLSRHNLSGFALKNKTPTEGHLENYSVHYDTP